MSSSQLHKTIKTNIIDEKTHKYINKTHIEILIHA